MPPGAAATEAERYRRMVRARLVRYVRATLIGLGLFPWLLPWARSYLPLGRLGEVFDQLFIVVCHRQPERSIALAGTLMPLCTRCAGIFLGLALGAMLAWPRVSLKLGRGLLLAAGLLMLAEVLRQDLGAAGLSHPLRILSGLLLGYAAALTVVSALRGEPPAEPRGEC